jgi:vacuolar-type H+-ATPase subunit C/Vma6
MNAQLKELAYGAAYNAFLNSNRSDRTGLNETQIKIANWLEPSMADTYAKLMVASKGNQKESLNVVYKIYDLENLKVIFQAINDGKSEEEITGLIKF